MDPYHHHHHHHHHHRPNQAAPSAPPFESSSSAISGRPYEGSSRVPARVAGRHQLPGGPGPPQAMQFSLQTNFNRAYDSESTSPGEAGAPIADPFVQANTSAASTTPGSGGTPNPKRAYRQRRKDPSCDACRERKVKCDATETTSCSECSSRNVRCQFTKETNRRMSSIKQFQDLERQLQQARQQLAHFRSIMPKGAPAMEVELASPSYHGAELHPVGSPPPRRKKPAMLRDFSQVRANLTDYGRGLLQIPSPYRVAVPPRSNPSEMPDLPPRHIADRLLASYHENFHLHFPVLHWSTFESECDKLYGSKSLASLGNAWGAVFLCVLACGTLHTLGASWAQDGKAFLTTAIGMTSRWQDEFSIEDARMAFLTGVFLTELNLKSAGWVWLGSAIRISQDIGLHVASGPWSPVEGEMRRRLWYSIYVWDRTLALELGKPLLIRDEDYDTEYPEPAEDEQITPGGVYPTGQSTPLLAMVNVVRSFESLKQIFKSPYISPEILQSREEYLHSCFSMFPKAFQPSAVKPLDPRNVAPLICLQNARLILHRHNLTPVSPHDLRLQAIDKCVMVARDSASTLARCLDPALSPEHELTERSRLLAASASTLLCMHIWRCLLFLLFRAEYRPAIALVQAASVIGGARRVNLCCGRHLEFFLRVLYSRLQQGHSGDFDDDEEIIAYVSGDLQSNPDTSWVWQARETGLDSGNLANSAPGLSSYDQTQSSRINKIDSLGLSDLEAQDWGGWDQVESSVQYLHERQQSQRRKAQTAPQQQASVSPPSDTSRMTIANIIGPRESIQQEI